MECPSEPSDLLLTRTSKNGSFVLFYFHCKHDVQMDVIEMFQEFLQFIFSVSPHHERVIHIPEPYRWLLFRPGRKPLQGYASGI
jgi:hypothetical protein